MKAHARNHQAFPARSLMPDVNGHFGRTWTGNQIGGPEHVEKIRMGNPAAPPNKFLFHHGDVGGGAAECGRAQSQERERNLLELSAGGVAG